MAEPTDEQMIAWLRDYAEEARAYGLGDANMAEAIAARLRAGAPAGKSEPPASSED